MLALALASPALAQATGSARFDVGVAAFQRGDYEAALAAFLEARAAGFDGPELHFDLGLAYYKLARHDEARAAFERLREEPGYAGVADFHLGLVAARLGENERALELWRGVERTASEPELRERARLAQARLIGPRPVSSAYVFAAAGHDGNPALLDDASQSVDAESGTRELFGSFDLPLGSGADATTWLRGGGYLRDYSHDNGLDQRGLFASLANVRGSGERRRTVSADTSATQLDGERFTEAFSAGIENEPASGENGYGLRGQLSRITAGGPYAHLDGWRLRAELDRQGRLGSARVLAGYQFEGNDRADLSEGQEFFSHSAMRHRFSLSLEHPAPAGWSLRWLARWRASRYRDPDVFLDGAQLREELREERLLEAGVRARRPVGRSSGVLLEYQYSRNASTIDGFDYQRHLVTAGLEWFPRAD